MKHVQVHKFGGSSLANADRFRAVKALLPPSPNVAVLSAVHGTTSLLQSALDQACYQRDFSPILANIRQTHLELLTDLLTEATANTLLEMIDADLDEIRDILQAALLVGVYSDDIRDRVLGFGELWSCKIFNQLLVDTHKTLLIDASKVLFVTHKHQLIHIDWERSLKALNEMIAGNNYDALIVTGFIAAQADGRRTTLGRNGSDFSAAIFAKLLQATSLTIWTDVDGVYSADPRKVRSAFAIPELSYEEALELAYFGAGILHPKTIMPAVEQQIPIYIKNSYNPGAPGSCIKATVNNTEYPIRGLTSIDNVALINIEGTGMIGVTGTSARVFDTMRQADISVILISQASSEHSICFSVRRTQAEAAIKALNEAFAFEISENQIQNILLDKDCAILAAVGDGMVGYHGIAGRLCGTLAKANVNIRAIAQGSSERNISIVLHKDDINRSLRAVHSGFYLSNKTLSIGLIGPGIVGSALLDQIHSELEKLAQNHNVNLRVRGIMNSKKMLLDDTEINLGNWHQQFEQTEQASNLELFISHIISDDIPHAVIVDCSSNQTIAEHYLDFIQQGAHVITPNKKAGSGDFDYYQALLASCHESGRLFLYETTVCAGLPVIKTLQDLRQTGDEILQVEGIVSGTLSYIFNALSTGKTFSEVITQAKASGYTEPDPRDDLSGMDVARKVVVLAREMGFDTTLEDVAVHNLVPETLRNCSVDEFMQRLPEYDEIIEDELNVITKSGEIPRYVGSIDNEGNVNVCVQSYPSTHPFGQLQGTDNIIIFKTRRYHEQPLVVQGPGAGAEVTAAGIFADILRLTSSLSE